MNRDLDDVRGLAFPFRITGGGVQRARGNDKIRQNLRQLLLTRLGERVMRRDYGASLRQRLHGPNDGALRTLLKHELEQAIRRFLPLVRLTAPLRFRASGSELFIVIEYRTELSRAPESLELPIR